MVFKYSEDLLERVARQIRDEIDEEIIDDLIAFSRYLPLKFGSLLRHIETGEMYIVFEKKEGSRYLKVYDPQLNIVNADLHDFDIINKVS